MLPFPPDTVGGVLLRLFSPEQLPVPVAGGVLEALTITPVLQVCASLAVPAGTPLPPEGFRLRSEAVDETHHLHHVIIPYSQEHAGDALVPDALLYAPTDAGAPDRVRAALTDPEHPNVAHRLVLAALPLVQPESLARWLEHTMPARLMAHPWATLTEGTLTTWSGSFQILASLEGITTRIESGGLAVSQHVVVRVVQKALDGTVVDVRIEELRLGIVPERARRLPVPPDLDAVLERWVQASIRAIQRFWSVQSDEQTCQPGSLPFPVCPGLLLTAHARWGPPPPRPEPLRLKGTPRLVLHPDEQPTFAHFEIGPDRLEISSLHGRDLQITLHTPEGAVLLLSRDGHGAPVEVLPGEGAAMRALVQWLVDAVRQADDPLICLLDTEDKYDEEGTQWFLCDFLGASPYEVLDWRIEPDAFCAPRALPDRIGAARIWADFLQRHSV